MKTNHNGILGVFYNVKGVLLAIDKLKKQGENDFKVFSPINECQIEVKLDSPHSPIKRYTLIGGITGCLSGFALTILTSLHWPLMTSAKPIVSIPPFLIICFEMTILFSALATVMGFIIHGILPELNSKEPYDERFSNDTFGMYVRCPKEKQANIETILQEAGADEIRSEVK